MPEGKIIERFLDERRATARLECPASHLPKPGQYLMAFDPESDAPLAVQVFSAGNTRDGFLSATELPKSWQPGISLSLRGPFGHGFALPPAARKVALVAWDASPAYLLSLVAPARSQEAAISLVCEKPPEDLPADIEINPPSAFTEISHWADYMALIGTRNSIHGWREKFSRPKQLLLPREAQALVLLPMPCGGLAKCGVCSVETKRGVELVCEDGPVFQLTDLL